MTDYPLVSIIMIFFNGEKFIEEAIESIFAQTYQSWELLLVDDGSADRSTAIARRYTKQFPDQVRYLEHEGHQNQGMSTTRNLGIRNARGEYIAFLDCDDVWLPHQLERYVVALESQPEAAMVYSSTLKWYSWTGKPEDAQRDQLYEMGVPTEQLIKPPVLLNLLIQQKISAPCTCSLLVRCNCLRDIGLFEAAFPGMHEDQVFYAKVFLNVSVFVAEGYGAKYRIHPDSCVSISQKAGQEYAAHLNFINWVKEYLVENKVHDSDLWKSLHQQLWRYRYIVLKQLLKQLLYPLKPIKRIISLKYSG